MANECKKKLMTVSVNTFVKYPAYSTLDVSAPSTSAPNDSALRRFSRLSLPFQPTKHTAEARFAPLVCLCRKKITQTLHFLQTKNNAKSKKNISKTFHIKNAIKSVSTSRKYCFRRKKESKGVIKLCRGKF
jgi:hypothetical protein